jgi:DAHP synthetase family protein
VLLKRGMSATLEEFLMAAEYVLSEGNYKVVLCERGVRTFADHTRNTLEPEASSFLGQSWRLNCANRLFGYLSPAPATVSRDGRRSAGIVYSAQGDRSPMKADHE